MAEAGRHFFVVRWMVIAVTLLVIAQRCSAVRLRTENDVGRQLQGTRDNQNSDDTTRALLSLATEDKALSSPSSEAKNSGNVSDNKQKSTTESSSVSTDSVSTDQPTSVSTGKSKRQDEALDSESTKEVSTPSEHVDTTSSLVSSGQSSGGISQEVKETVNDKAPPESNASDSSFPSATLESSDSESPANPTGNGNGSSNGDKNPSANGGGNGNGNGNGNSNGNALKSTASASGDSESPANPTGNGNGSSNGDKNPSANGNGNGNGNANGNGNGNGNANGNGPKSTSSASGDSEVPVNSNGKGGGVLNSSKGSSSLRPDVTGDHRSDRGAVLAVPLNSPFTNDDTSDTSTTRVSPVTSTSVPSTRPPDQLARKQENSQHDTPDGIIGVVPISASTPSESPQPLAKTASTPVSESSKVTSARGEDSANKSPSTHSQGTSDGVNIKDPLPGSKTESSVIPGTVSASSSAAEKETSETDHKATDHSKQQGTQSNAETMSVKTLDSATEEGKQYVRGDPTFGAITIGSGSSIFDQGGDGSSPLVIGGKKRGWQAEATSGLYAPSSRFQNMLRYSVCAAAVISVILLMVFHFEVLNKGLARHFPPGSTWAPNAWEFVLYAQYIQQIATISTLTLLKTPYFLWDFTDLFSWTHFLVYRAQEEAVVGRRLATIILGGLVGYGDRIGTPEIDLMYRTCTGFACVGGFFICMALGAGTYNKWRVYIGEKGHKGVVWRCFGLILLIWFFSLLPLTMAVSFELSMEFKSHMLELWPLVAAFLVVALVVVGVVIVLARTILHSTKRDLRRLRSRALWGAFYSDTKHGGRLFFLLAVVHQICTGLCTGLLETSVMILVLLVTLHVVFLLAVFLVKPFQDTSPLVKRATYAITSLKLVNLFLAFAFLPSSTLSLAGLGRVANTLIGLNSLVIFVWCLRHIFIFGKLALASAKMETESRLVLSALRAIDISPSTSLNYELVTKGP